MARRIQLRRDTKANFLAANPILEKQEAAYTIDTKHVYVGDGKTPFSELKPARKVAGS